MQQMEEMNLKHIQLFYIDSSHKNCKQTKIRYPVVHNHMVICI